MTLAISGLPCRCTTLRLLRQYASGVDCALFLMHPFAIMMLCFGTVIAWRDISDEPGDSALMISLLCTSDSTSTLELRITKSYPHWPGAYNMDTGDFLTRSRVFEQSFRPKIRHGTTYSIPQYSPNGPWAIVSGQCIFPIGVSRTINGRSS